MIIFETDENGCIYPKEILQKDFVQSVNINDMKIKPQELIKYNMDTLNGIRRKVVLTNDEILNQNRALIKLFLRSKKLEGCSDDTIQSYSNALTNFCYTIILPINEITTDDVRNYIIDYFEYRNVKYNTIDSLRVSLNAFFNWAEDEDYILKNPCRKIHKIRGETIIKHPFTEEDIEKLKDACMSMRELAIIDFLNSSGVRASELCKLNIMDMDIDNKKGFVQGKGNKQRYIYINNACKIHLKKYLSFRHDYNPALFISSKRPYGRLSKRGLEFITSEIGRRAGIPDCYPHRFRRTLATRLLTRGVPIEQVQRILGHNNIQTTLIYAKVSDQDIVLNHNKYS